MIISLQITVATSTRGFLKEVVFGHLEYAAAWRQGFDARGVNRVPTIVVWPGKHARQPQRRDYSNLTLYAILKGQGIALPKNHPVDGIDIGPALKGQNLERDGIFLLPVYCSGAGIVAAFHVGTLGQL